jgi:hypothetical protein
MLSDLHHNDGLLDVRQMRETAKQFASAFAPPAPATATKPDTAFAEISTDVSYLPDLTAYLDDLLRTRERLAATRADDWARSAATPSDQEISKVRELISRIKGDIAALPAGERARIDEAVATVRKHRAVSLGMPRPRQQAR